MKRKSIVKGALLSLILCSIFTPVFAKTSETFARLSAAQPKTIVIAGGEISITVPAGFKPLSKAESTKLYKITPGPEAVWHKPTDKGNITLVVISPFPDKPVGSEDMIPKIAQMLQSRLEKESVGGVTLTNKAVNGHKVSRLEYVMPAINQKKTLIHTVAQISEYQDRVLMVTFSGPQGIMKASMLEAIASLDSVKF
ncbi:TPA: hypothetical protein ACPY0B_001886 [Citrobacter farmeri]|nr:hypothetical protein [Citrobacter farmeri]